MARGVRVRVLLGALLSLALLPAHAHAAECHDCLGLALSRAETGWVQVKLHATEDVNVTVTEQVGDQAEPVATRAVVHTRETTIRHASRWRCDRLQRVFTAVATFADGVTQTTTSDLKTPSCRKRLTLHAHARKGRVTVRVRDRFRV